MLAIVIPYFKYTFFNETLQSLANQKDKRFKVYIGDDASQENPIDLLEKYQGQFDFVYHRFGSNLGRTSLTKQWERCIALSREEDWLMILGDDDVLGENVVEAFYGNLEEIQRIGSTVVRFASVVIDGEGQTASTIFTHPKLETSTTAFWRRFKGNTRSSLSEYIFSRASVDLFGFKDYPLAWHSDDRAWLNFAKSNPIFGIQESYLKIRISKHSISGTNTNMVQKHLAEIMFLKDLLDDKSIKFSKKQQLELLYKFELSIKKIRNLYQYEWYFLVKKYFSCFSWFPVLKFTRRYFIQFLNKSGSGLRTFSNEIK